MYFSSLLWDVRILPSKPAEVALALAPCRTSSCIFFGCYRISHFQEDVNKLVTLFLASLQLASAERLAEPWRFPAGRVSLSAPNRSGQVVFTMDLTRMRPARAVGKLDERHIPMEAVPLQ